MREMERVPENRRADERELEEEKKAGAGFGETERAETKEMGKRSEMRRWPSYPSPVFDQQSVGNRGREDN